MPKFPTYKTVPVEKLVPYARNARTHSDEQVAQIAASIKEFGFLNPIIIDGENGIVAGHGRVLAARKLGMKELPCVEASHLTDAQRRAYILADNKLALNAGWDAGLLKIELSDLKTDGFDLSLTGFADLELADLLAERTEGLTDPDDAPEIAEGAVSAPGDVWLLGNHRIICGDSTDALVVEKVLNGVKPHLMVTDPQYGVEYDPTWREKYDNFERHARGKVENDDKADWRDVWALFPGSIAYVWHGGLHSSVVQESLEFCGFKMRAQIIWAKQHFVFSRGDYHWQHEPCWYAVKGVGNWAGDRKQTTIWNIQNNNPMGGERKDKSLGHGTQKPVECMRRPIENNSSPGQAVYEPFSGSGTTIIAAEQTGRHCYAIELNPLYVDMAIKRWQNFTGKEATHTETGRTFNSHAKTSAPTH